MTICLCKHVRAHLQVLGHPISTPCCCRGPPTQTPTHNGSRSHTSLLTTLLAAAAAPVLSAAAAAVPAAVVTALRRRTAVVPHLGRQRANVTSAQMGPTANARQVRELGSCSARRSSILLMLFPGCITAHERNVLMSMATCSMRLLTASRSRTHCGYAGETCFADVPACKSSTSSSGSNGGSGGSRGGSSASNGSGNSGSSSDESPLGGPGDRPGETLTPPSSAFPSVCVLASNCMFLCVPH